MPDPTDPLDFTPVILARRRHDGWTEVRQRRFIAALATSGSVKAAAISLGMSPESVYALRRRPGADSFAAAWDHALDLAAPILADVALDRAVNGVAVPIMHDGHQVGERRHYSDRLLMFMMRHRLPDTYGALNPPGRFPTRQQVEDADDDTAQRAAEARARIVSRIWRSRALLLSHIAHSPMHRAAWELLCGPTDWTVDADPDNEPAGIGPESVIRPRNLIPALYGGWGVDAQLDGPVDPDQRARPGPHPPRSGGDDPAAVDQWHDATVDTFYENLVATGWTRDDDGNWLAPPPDPDHPDNPAAPGALSPWKADARRP